MIQIPESSAGGDQLTNLLQMQSDFHARLADETLRYLRGLQTVLAPAAPGTVVLPDRAAMLRAHATVGGQATLAVDIVNAQRSHTVVQLALSQLVSSAGITWFAELALDTTYVVVPPGGSTAATLRLVVPAELPPGSYRGALLTVGLAGGVPVLVTITAPSDGDTTPGARQ